MIGSRIDFMQKYIKPIHEFSKNLKNTKKQRTG